MVFAGPHGSGKSSIFDEARQLSCLPERRINPDEVIRDKAFEGDPRSALSFAAKLRKHALVDGESIAFETITSLRVLREAKARGYRIELTFVTTSDPEINKARVRHRVDQGGHNIPPDKIMDGYARSMRELAEAVSIADEARVYDNSIDRNLNDNQPLLVLHKQSAGNIHLIDSYLRPAWVDE